MKNNQEVIEITKRNENKKDFSFISEGELQHQEIITFSTFPILKHLSESDIADGLVSEDIKGFNKNIKNILIAEKISQEGAILSFQYKNFAAVEMKKEAIFIEK